jgi:hypothetical protein
MQKVLGVVNLRFTLRLSEVRRGFVHVEPADDDTEDAVEEDPAIQKWLALCTKKLLDRFANNPVRRGTLREMADLLQQFANDPDRELSLRHSFKVEPER